MRNIVNRIAALEAADPPRRTDIPLDEEAIVAGLLDGTWTPEEVYRASIDHANFLAQLAATISMRSSEGQTWLAEQRAIYPGCYPEYPRTTERESL